MAQSATDPAAAPTGAVDGARIFVTYYYYYHYFWGEAATLM